MKIRELFGGKDVHIMMDYAHIHLGSLFFCQPLDRCIAVA